jgi:hypothetical protein
LTGTVAAVFIVLHVLHFRFSDENTLHSAPDKAMDMHALVLKVVAENMILYSAGIVAIGLHLYSGWAKVAKKMGLSKEELQPAIDLGQRAALGLTLGFFACLCKAFMDSTATAGTPVAAV